MIWLSLLTTTGDLQYMSVKLSKITKKKQKSILKRLKSKCWKVVSEWVRRNENGVCFTCGAKQWDSELGQNNWKVMQAGHYIHGALDYDEMNIHCQCVRCNKWLSGNLGEYTMKLISKYGIEEVEKLRIRASMAKKGEFYTEEGLLAVLEFYKNKLKEL